MIFVRSVCSFFRGVQRSSVSRSAGLIDEDTASERVELLVITILSEHEIEIVDSDRRINYTFLQMVSFVIPLAEVIKYHSVYDVALIKVV